MSDSEHTSIESFCNLEFMTLRKEIEETKSRIYKTLSFGVFLIPGAQYIATMHNVQELSMAVPLLVIVVVLIHLAEIAALMRCGRYIRLVIEPYLAQSGCQLKGWEAWLEESEDRRGVDRWMTIASYVLFLTYYFLSILFVYTAARTIFSEIWAIFLIIVYAVIGVAVLVYVVQQWPWVTRTTHPRS